MTNAALVPVPLKLMRDPKPNRGESTMATEKIGVADAVVAEHTGGGELKATREAHLSPAREPGGETRPVEARAVRRVERHGGLRPAG